MLRFSKLFSIFSIFISLLIFFGCSSNQTSSDSGLSGTIEIDGSSTVFPISVAAAEIFREDNPNVQIPVGISGTGGGMKRFIVGETAITNASRLIKDNELSTASENGIKFTELEVAFDGLSVVVNKNNDWVDCLTTDELKKNLGYRFRG